MQNIDLEKEDFITNRKWQEFDPSQETDLFKLKLKKAWLTKVSTIMNNQLDDAELKGGYDENWFVSCSKSVRWAEGLKDEADAYIYKMENENGR